VKTFLAQGWPAISVDAKKKENLGNYANKGREYQKKGAPVEVNVYDFVNKTLGQAIPYGIYDIGRNQGFVNLGVSHDTAEFAVNSIRQWWQNQGHATYATAPALLITAAPKRHPGGSNGSRVRLWKVELQRLADELGLRLAVCHYPPGTSKWNKIEHRMFCYISQNWRGKPLRSREVMLKLISHTTTTAGLTITAQLDEQRYEKGRIVTDQALAAVNLARAEFHGEWNYVINPLTKQQV